LEGDLMLPVSELNRLRREAVAALLARRTEPLRWTLSPPTQVLPPVPPAAEQTEPEVIAVTRDLAQFEAALGCAGIATFYCEFENPKHYRDAVARFRSWQAEQPSCIGKSPTIWVAPPRVFKPGEEWILNIVRSSRPDGFLVRNPEHLRFLAGARQRGDFSFNVANPLTAEYLLQRYGLERVTASYDLNIAQLESLLQHAPAAVFDITLHQRMPMFHMEHCVFCAFLTTGRDYRDCGRPCETRRVSLRDRVGAELPLKADAGCRNTVYNNRAQTGAEYAQRLITLGARHFRVEFVHESPGEVQRTLLHYQRLLRGEISGTELWRELKLLNQLGVTRGQMETAPQALLKKR
jgi:U32 family peptidase